ncbi:MAG: fatty acid hydroxylase family protein [Alphaproteobacteria bacterium]|nr:MAG: fatty acid hydroxylase family protein [Alphaproteobacteria bacterium]
MDLKDLIRVYFTYPAVIVYLVLGGAGFAWAVLRASALWPLAAAVGLVALVYPLVWYLLHRFVLHGRFLYRHRFTAKVWKRIHFDHHQDPHDLRVLFGALYTTVPTIGLVTVPIGWAVGGEAGAAAAFAAGMLTTCFYEFAHCIQHLNHTPKSPALRRIKRLHMAHHFHNETGNFGITSFVWDRLFGTLYEKPSEVPRSASVFNLGYTTAEAERYPWVARLSPPVTSIGAHRERRRPRGLEVPSMDRTQA